MAEHLGLSEAISRYVQDGDTVALEGFTHLIPFAAGHEIIRQQKRDLTVSRMTPDLIYDQLIGARLGVMDSTAAVMCRDNNLPIRVYDVASPGDLLRIVKGENVGTLVTSAAEQG